MVFIVILLIVLLVILALAGTRRAEFLIVRSIDIAAPATEVFNLINTLRSWEQWNPNFKSDPGAERAYAGPASGAGATATWRGKRAGTGHMEILEASAPGLVVVAVEFEKPFKARNINSFRLTSVGDITSITWAMQGPMPFIAKVMGLVVNMNTMMGSHFETGLANLRTLAQRGSAAQRRGSRRFSAAAPNRVEAELVTAAAACREPCRDPSERMLMPRVMLEDM